MLITKQSMGWLGPWRKPWPMLHFLLLKGHRPCFPSPGPNTFFLTSYNPLHTYLSKSSIVWVREAKQVLLLGYAAWTQRWPPFFEQPPFWNSTIQPNNKHLLCFLNPNLTQSSLKGKCAMVMGKKESVGPCGKNWRGGEIAWGPVASLWLVVRGKQLWSIFCWGGSTVTSNIC